MIRIRHTCFARPVHAGLEMLLCFTVFTSACAHHRSRAARPSPPSSKSRSVSQRKKSSPIVSSALNPADETGLASWYGYPYDGRRAASGEIFDKEKLTAAHRTLPFQTCVVVTNLTNGRQVEVRITDRGPFIDGRIIDLSEAAAREIDMVRAGVAQVSLHVVGSSGGERPSRNPPPPVEPPVIPNPVPEPIPVSPAPRPEPPPQVSPSPPVISDASRQPAPSIAPSVYVVQAGSFSDREQAELRAEAISKVLGAARVAPGNGHPIYWRVIVGRRLTLEQAGGMAARVAKISGSAVVVIDPFTQDSE